MIHGIVKGQTLRLIYSTVVADTIAYLSATFSFEDKAWEGLSKWVHFKKGNDVFSAELVNDTLTADRHLNLSAGEWEVYLHGTKTENGDAVCRITTIPQKLIVYESGILDGEPLPVEPLSVGEQILAAASEALSVAKKAEENTAQYAQNMDIVLEALLIEQESILAMQDALIGGLV